MASSIFTAKGRVFVKQQPTTSGTKTQTQPRVVVATSAFGRRLISKNGQAAVLSWLADAGADGVEIRRELLPTGFADFTGLGRACADHSLSVIYSAADKLWAGPRPSPTIMARLQEAVALNAQAIKFSLGHYIGQSGADWASLTELLRDQPLMPILVENDQTIEGGTMAPLAACLTDAQAMGFSLHLTFDIGNWQWTDTDATLAAERLGHFVRYLHCKGVIVRDGIYQARSPTTADFIAWRKLMTRFPAKVTRAIEFPLQAADLAVHTRSQVDLLRSL